MYAVIETGGKQYRIKEGDKIYVEKLDAKTHITFQKVLSLETEDGIQVGTPYIKNAKVGAKILKHGKSKKITVFTYRPKKDSKRKMGHRQPYTQIEIESIQTA